MFCGALCRSNPQSHSSPVLQQVRKKPEASGSEEATSKPPAASGEKKPAGSKAPAKASATTASGGGGKGKAKGKAAVGKFDEPPDIPEPNIPVSGWGVSSVCVW